MKATLVLSEKRLVIHSTTGASGIIALQIWEVPRSGNYPVGRKFSLFLVVGGEVVVGMDNHKPKGPHLHLGEQEFPYLYRDEASLFADFWNFVRKAGFEP